MAQENIKQHINTAQAGLDMDKSSNQIDKGKLTYALNASVESFDNDSVNYQNEQGNELCLVFPENYQVIGKHYIPEISKHVFFLSNPITGDSEIGYMENNDCVYRTYINSKCLNFNIDYPILKCVHKITNCTTEIYWTDGYNERRFLDLNNIPYKTEIVQNQCDPKITSEIDCNKISVLPQFAIPQLQIGKVISGGNLTAGTVQFAIQYCDVSGNGYTSYYSVTNPVPIADKQKTIADFNYNVGKSVEISISNIDITGYFQYFNLAVIKTINAISSVELIGTYFIDSSSKNITYSGQNRTQIKLSISDIFEKFPQYEIAQDVTSVQDILVWDNLSSIDRINLQKIANKINLLWQTWRIPANEDYSNEINATNFRGYMRDEVYPYEIVFLRSKGKQTDGFHIPGRAISPRDISFGDVLSTNPDFIGEFDPDTGASPYWKIYNTASVINTESGYVPYSDYKGPYQYGEFAYWESTELYPCDPDIWGELAGKPIRHHKFPDVSVSPIFESKTPSTDGSGYYINLEMGKAAIFPIGVRVDISEIQSLIAQSDLPEYIKNDIVGFKIVRGNRDANKSIVGKGILRNVGKYTREGTEYYFPNYPYNDLREDPFLLEKPNAYNAECYTWKITPTSDGVVQYTDCFSNNVASEPIINGVILSICSLSTPTIITGTGTVEKITYDSYVLTVGGSSETTVFTYTNIDNDTVYLILNSGESRTVQVKSGTFVSVFLSSTKKYTIDSISYNKNNDCYPNNLKAFETDDSKYRSVLNSPDTSFGQPFLGNVLKLENVLYGAGKAHYVQVKKNALYKLLSKEAQEDALDSAAKIADITGTFSASAMFTAYQAYLQIYINGITRRNYGWSYNSVVDYLYSSPVNNGEGVKQRKLSNAQYLIPGVQSVNEDIRINNYQRESSVYLKTDSEQISLPFPSQSPSLLDSGNNSLIEDKSRYINSEKDCSSPENEFDISSVVYYASLKNILNNQWGQIYSYETIDTGFQVIFDALKITDSRIGYVFGGDTFINLFSLKTKLPFFIDNRVNAPDDSDIFYDEIGNVAYPEYWHSARSILFDYKGTAPSTPLLKNIISIKAHYLDCPNNQLPAPDSSSNPPIVNPGRTFYDGKMYMFAYGIPSFYCESSVNVDLRQAFNNREGDFYPHVGTSIPDDWLQESFVTINQDNTYYYNVTFSKQNKENYFSHLPSNWRDELCFTNFPFRAIYSDSQQSFSDNRINSWLIYRPVSYFDFPQNYGKLVSLDGIQNKAVLARFENKTLLYNNLLTINTSNPQAAYIGNDTLFKSAPPIDFADTDLGFVGSQHKFLLKIPQGQITVDAKRGQVFLLSGSQVTDLSAFGRGLNKFLTNNLSFDILKKFPNINIDNNYKGIGLHGVYDSKYDRVIITKLDYYPLIENVKYNSETQEFYIEKLINNVIFKQNIDLDDKEYFCNKSWTLSFNINTGTWISFHSYIPNWYIGESNFFYSGINNGCDLEAIAAEIGEFTTTTTTTTIFPYNCDLQGNARQAYCELDGYALFLKDCNLEGDAFFIFSTTTTSTTTTIP